MADRTWTAEAAVWILPATKVCSNVLVVIMFHTTTTSLHIGMSQILYLVTILDALASLAFKLRVSELVILFHIFSLYIHSVSTVSSVSSVSTVSTVSTVSLVSTVYLHK